MSNSFFRVVVVLVLKFENTQSVHSGVTVSQEQVQPNWQPHLFGQSLRLHPLVESDFELLFAAASDPLIWGAAP
jgi:hypothetical protein